MVKAKELSPWYFYSFGFLVISIFLIIRNMKNKPLVTSTTNQDKNATLGQRNNNPLNIRPLATAQPGQISTYKNFIVFKSIEYGYRCAIKLLWEYYSTHGCNTIAKIVTRWAPPTVDNNKTAEYIAFVSKDSGIGPNERLDFTTRSDYNKVLVAMSVNESRIRPTQQQLDEAWALSQK
jgi:hypothetical protein